MDYFDFGIGLCLSGFPFSPIYRWLACWRHFLCPLSCLFSSYQLCSLLKAQQTERGKKTSIFYEGNMLIRLKNWFAYSQMLGNRQIIFSHLRPYKTQQAFLRVKPHFDATLPVSLASTQTGENSILSNMLKTITAKISIFICRSSSSCSPYFSLIFLSFVWKVKNGYD